MRSTYLPIGLALAALVGCAEKKAVDTVVPVTSVTAKSAPAWIDNEEYPDGLAAVGVAQPNPMGDPSFQRTTAVNDGRAKLAAKVKVRVQNMFSALTQQVTKASTDGQKPVKLDVMNRVQENVTRTMTDQELNGSNSIRSWTDPANGNYYVFMVMTKEAMDRALHGVAKNQIDQEIAKGEVSLDKALDKLDAAIAASEPGAH